jgi:hypothetical protein
LTTKLVTIAICATLIVGATSCELGLAEAGAGLEMGAIEGAEAGGIALRASTLEAGATEGAGILADARAIAAGDEAVAVARIGGSALRNVLSEMATEEGSGGALAVRSTGEIVAGNRVIGAVTARGELIGRLPKYGTRMIGRVADGKIWSLRESGGSAEAVAELRGATVNNGIWIREAPNARAAFVEILRPRVPFRVLEVSGGWYRVSFGETPATGWVPVGALEVAVFPFIGIVDSTASSWARRVVADATSDYAELALVRLATGSSFVSADASHRGNVWQFITPDGSRIVSTSGGVARISPMTVSRDASAAPIQFFRIAGRPPVAVSSCTERGDAVLLEKVDGVRVVVPKNQIDHLCPDPAPSAPP